MPPKSPERIFDKIKIPAGIPEEVLAGAPIGILYDVPERNFEAIRFSKANSTEIPDENPREFSKKILGSGRILRGISVGYLDSCPRKNHRRISVRNY